jgi:hypothetical protein
MKNFRLSNLVVAAICLGSVAIVTSLVIMTQVPVRFTERGVTKKDIPTVASTVETDQAAEKCSTGTTPLMIPKGWQNSSLTELDFLRPKNWIVLSDHDGIGYAMPGTKMDPEPGEINAKGEIVYFPITSRLVVRDIVWPLVDGAVILIRESTSTLLWNYAIAQGQKTEICGLVKLDSKCAEKSCGEEYRYLKGDRVYSITIRYENPGKFPSGMSGAEFVQTILTSLH